MKKSFSILISIILLASQMYLTVGTHFCGGKAVDARIFVGDTHLGCAMHDQEKLSFEAKDQSLHPVAMISQVPCCQNEYQVVQTPDEFIADTSQPLFDVDFAVAFIYTALNLELANRATYQHYTLYLSPPLEKDIPVLFQTFLI